MNCAHCGHALSTHCKGEPAPQEWTSGPAGRPGEGGFTNAYAPLHEADLQLRGLEEIKAMIC